MQIQRSQKLFPVAHSTFAHLPKINLIKKPTPVHRLDFLGEEMGVADLWIKREDLTAPGYGGNKVRNLEYLLGHAERNKIEELTTAAPKGSNFVAALAYHGSMNGFKVRVEQFCPAESEQINQHDHFSIRSGASITKHTYAHPYLGASVGFLKSVYSAHLQKNTFRVPTGGSSPLGALGHASALIEMTTQMKNHMPDYIVVGVGTCGTIAGLNCGIKLLGLKTKVIGVRCVDQVMANKFNAYTLVHKTLARVGSRLRMAYKDIHLVDPTEKAMKYGAACKSTGAVIEFMAGCEGIRLDTTYTSKVVLGLKRLAKTGIFARKKVLYWHTFDSSM